VPLIALVDTTNSQGVKRKYFHDKDPEASPKARRPNPCAKNFNDFDLAAKERNGLEIHRAMPIQPRSELSSPN
jgi:hypothetical protein